LCAAGQGTAGIARLFRPSARLAPRTLPAMNELAAPPPAGRRLRWPLPALLAWLAAAAVAQGLAAADAGPVPALLAGSAAGALLALAVRGRWRRAITAAGFPLAALLLAAAGAVPAWAWGLAALPLLLAYPLRGWRDAPLFPTPAGALQGLAQACAAAPPRTVLDAGCGLGHGLAELGRVWPQAERQGVECSRALAWLAARRDRRAHIHCGDMWARSWAAADLVYLFQRPESMPRAAAKALAELRPGAWLVSLEFPVPHWTAAARLEGGPAGRPVWVYRIGCGTPPGSTAPDRCR
jgi:hypothetical protein